MSSIIFKINIPKTEKPAIKPPKNRYSSWGKITG